MTDILNKTIVLVLNRNWQAINTRTPADAFCQMATNVATALDIDGENHIRPVTWAEWITLPIRDGKAVNARKGNRLPHEAGLTLLAVPRTPKELPVMALIRNAPGIADWNLFVKE